MLSGEGGSGLGGPEWAEAGSCGTLQSVGLHPLGLPCLSAGEGPQEGDPADGSVVLSHGLTLVHRTTRCYQLLRGFPRISSSGWWAWEPHSFVFPLCFAPLGRRQKSSRPGICPLLWAGWSQGLVNRLGTNFTFLNSQRSRAGGDVGTS